MVADNFPNEVLRWYEENGRSFPWREQGLSPHEALLTEFLLQRTRAETVEEVWNEILGKYPSLESIQEATEEQLSKDLEGLGFHNRRARDIKKTANILLEERDGHIPDSKDELLELPGVGDYIASATLCFGLEKRAAIADSNVKRVIEYLFDIEAEEDLRNDKRVLEKAEEMLPQKDFKKFNWALLDLGDLLRRGEEPAILEELKESIK